VLLDEVDRADDDFLLDLLDILERAEFIVGDIGVHVRLTRARPVLFVLTTNEQRELTSLTFCRNVYNARSLGWFYAPTAAGSPRLARLRHERSLGVAVVRIGVPQSSGGGVEVVRVALDRLTQDSKTAIDDARPLGRRGVAIFVVPVPPLVSFAYGSVQQ